MSLTTDPKDPRLNKVEPSGMNEAYLVLPEEERAKGFIRPFRNKYIHKGIRPKYKLKDLSKKDLERFKPFGYIKFEKYPKGSLEAVGSSIGRYWTEKTLNSGCGETTTMGDALSETYARDPKFYGATFCATCGKHYPVAEFVWTDGEVVGS